MALSALPYEKQKYWLAARDNRIDVLMKATKRDMARTDEDGMTAVHWAAYHGHLEALRCAVGRGGDADQTDLWCNTALHHAARNAHLNCVTFLVNFGCNLWTLNTHGHTALQEAALTNQQCTDTVVQYLDFEMGKQNLLNPKLTQKKREQSVARMEKRRRKLKLDETHSNRGHDDASSSSTGGSRNNDKKSGSNLSKLFRLRRRNQSMDQDQSDKTDRLDAQTQFSYDPLFASSTPPSDMSQSSSTGTATSLFDRPGFGTISFLATYDASELCAARPVGSRSPPAQPSAFIASKQQRKRAQSVFDFQSDPIHL